MDPKEVLKPLDYFMFYIIFYWLISALLLHTWIESVSLRSKEIAKFTFDQQSNVG